MTTKVKVYKPPLPEVRVDICGLDVRTASLIRDFLWSTRATPMYEYDVGELDLLANEINRALCLKGGYGFSDEHGYEFQIGSDAARGKTTGTLLINTVKEPANAKPKS